MRLTQLKLAGFKSFVDPTTLRINGDRVGVVGPNGCGKSNVMESVRWVLGESSAKEMRGDSMDAVIFNGSENRKPISRASVELIFDNSLGSAAGEWSQYAEISVKRMIERDKGSTYYINNTVVRRRDVADLFLGTGLGGRAYAIIGQNTINRIVEAKPEELRIFLEEAAGISKYKERRRETELRLRDTSENLVRVQDILRELDKQIVRLESQAVIAEQYHQLQSTLNITKGQVWLLKKREASERWQAAQRFVEKLVNDLETQIAALRHSESALETARQQQFNATDAMNLAQTQYYEANAQVSTLENQVKHLNETNERMQLQLQQLHIQAEKNVTEQADLHIALQAALDNQKNLNQDFSQTEANIALAKVALNQKIQAYQNALSSFNHVQTEVMQAEQRLRIEQSNHQFIDKNVAEANAQLVRLQQLLSQIQIPDDTLLDEKQHLLQHAEQNLLKIEKENHDLQQQEQLLNTQLKQTRDTQQQHQKTLHSLQAEIDSLNKIQQSIRSGNNENALMAWLRNAQLDTKLRIWQTLRIKKGWGAAIEAALGTRLNAVVNNVISSDIRPPSALSLALIHNAPTLDQPLNNSIHTPLFSLIEKIDPATKSVVEDWLTGFYVLEDDADLNVARASLANGETLINQQGDIFTKYSVSFYGPQSALHGVLERQTHLDALKNELPKAENQFAAFSQQVSILENQLQDLRESQKALALQLKNATQQVHQFNLQWQQLKQQQQNAMTQQKNLQTDLVIAQEKITTLTSDKTTVQATIQKINHDLEAIKQVKQLNETEKNNAEQAQSVARNELQTLERGYQEKHFNIKIITNTIHELTDKLKRLDESNTTLKSRQEEIQTSLAASNVASFVANLEVALNQKQACEQALANARNLQSECDATLQQLERDRMKNEQLLHPLRDQVENSRLKEQEARLTFEQCQLALSSSQLHEQVLSEHLAQIKENKGDAGISIKTLESKRDRLLQEIDDLGAVNLAAIEELVNEKTRRDILTLQSNDLTEASETLLNAIKKIDKETAGRLQATFDQANLHFNDLFTTLFGGGQAKLELLGDEILDNGMQVFAQPPGKKNSTIHLLSGGEKALTAIALVFALFRLNPAPFCLMDEVDAPLDDSNTERFCAMVKKMSEKTQFLYVSHNKITMEMAQQLIGVTMQESGVSRIVDVDIEAAVRMVEEMTV